MAEGKKSFILYLTQRPIFEGLSDEDAGKLIKTVFAYVSDENPKPEGLIGYSFNIIKPILKNDLVNYEDKNVKMYEFANKRWQSKENVSMNMNANDCKSIHKDSVIVNDNVNVIVNDNDVSKDTNNINRSSKLDRYADLRKQILDYLNDSIGSHYRDCKANKRLIDSRLDDGYTLEDFKHVIDVKSYQWKDSDLQKYLRPETLFCASHFESYLNEEKQTGVKNNPFDLPDAGFRSL